MFFLFLALNSPLQQGCSGVLILLLPSVSCCRASEADFLPVGSPSSSAFHHPLRHSPSSTCNHCSQEQNQSFHSAESLFSGLFFLYHGLLFKVLCVYCQVFYISSEATKSRDHPIVNICCALGTRTAYTLRHWCIVV